MSLFDNNYPQFPCVYEIGNLPTEDECFALWEKYEMLENIKEHSMLVAQFARALAIKINEKYTDAVNIEVAYIAGLLHDIAKTWTIKYGGNHQLLGASIVRVETQSPYLASCVYHHVIWPWEKEGVLELEKMIFHVPILIAYSDKRIQHTEQVSLKKRFDDLHARYGKTQIIKDHIQLNYIQAQKTEEILSRKLEFNLNACTIDSGVLVPGA